MSDNIKTHKDLKVWQESIELVKLVYKTVNDFPMSEKYGLTSQIKRSAVSIPSNIAEGSARLSTKEYIHFLYFALGSLSELDTQIYIAKELDFVKNIDNIETSIVNIRKMLIGLIKHIKNKSSNL